MPNITNHQGNTNQTTMSYHLTPVRMAVTEKTKIGSAGKDVEEREPCALLVGM